MECSDVCLQPVKSVQHADHGAGVPQTILLTFADGLQSGYRYEPFVMECRDTCLRPVREVQYADHGAGVAQTMHLTFADGLQLGFLYEGAQLSLQEASQWLQKLLQEELHDTVDTILRGELLTACAVLLRFSLEGLVAGGRTVEEGDVQAALRNDLAWLPRIAGDRQWYTLKPESRMEGLNRLSSLESMRAARSWNMAQTTDTKQEVFDEFLEEDFSASESDDVQCLEAALQAATWLRPYAPRIPRQVAIEKRLAIRRLLYPMERLTRGFMGRQKELEMLRGFVGVLEPQSRIESLSRFLMRSATRQKPMMLSGIGGVGKSTLMAEFIRQHVRGEVPFPWIYLDFDNPRLNVSVLSTLIDEATEQLSAQYPSSDWSGLRLEAHNRSVLENAASYTSAEVNRSFSLTDSESSEYIRLDNAQQLAQLLADELMRAMESTGIEKMMGVAQTLPFLIVLDTFEEVQKRGVEMAQTLWGFLRSLQDAFPRVRIVLAGRAPVPELSQYVAQPEAIVLKEFDEESAIAFLRDREIPNLDAARALYKQVGGNPLNLKLAAHVAKVDPASQGGIQGLKTSSYYIFAASEHVIQGQLYQRILERIPFQDLQKLAHPGLVVRRITPDIIREVLAVPCGLGPIEYRRAQELFEELEKQVDLVTIEPDGALRHQQDVRRVMLKMLDAERPAQVHDIHERAFEFYKNLPGSTAAIEKVYHALQLGMDEQQIRDMEISEAAESLLSSVDELPPASQLLVYELTKREPPAEIRASANLVQWETFVEARARQAIQFGDYKAPLQLLNERQDRTPGSALYAILAICLLRSGNFDKADEQLAAGIESAQAVNRIDRLVELHRLRGELLERKNDYAMADVELKQAQQLAMRIGIAVLALQICAERSRLRLRIPLLPPPVEELEDIVKACGDSDFAAVRLQLQGLFRLCGGQCVPLLLKGLRVFKLESVFNILPPDAAWFIEANDMAKQNRANEFFTALLQRSPEDLQACSTISEILEQSLDPNKAARLA